jgi:hypothetical protein
MSSVYVDGYSIVDAYPILLLKLRVDRRPCDLIIECIDLARQYETETSFATVDYTLGEVEIT